MAKKAAAKRAVTRTNTTKVAPTKAASAKRVAAGKVGGRVAKPTVQPTPKLQAEPLMHRLDALLHTMRTIAQHEDELCTLLHDVRTRGKVSKPLLRELQTLLAALPSVEYTHDLYAVTELAG